MPSCSHAALTCGACPVQVKFQHLMHSSRMCPGKGRRKARHGVSKRTSLSYLMRQSTLFEVFSCNQRERVVLLNSFSPTETKSWTILACAFRVRVRCKAYLFNSFHPSRKIVFFRLGQQCCSRVLVRGHLQCHRSRRLWQKIER